MRDYSKQSFVNLTKIKLRSNISEVEDQKKIIIKLILPSFLKNLDERLFQAEFCKFELN